MRKHKKQFDLNTGDIIYYARNYFVLGLIEGKIECLPLNIGTKKHIQEFNRDVLEKIDYTQKVILDLDATDIHYLTSLDKDFTKCALDNYNLYRLRQQIVKRGAVVLVRGQLHYIYSEEGQDFVAFQLQNKYSDKLELIIINGKTYYINFGKIINISKKEEIEIKNLASEDEMIKIRNLKKSYFENADMSDSVRVRNLKVCRENLKPGTEFKLRDNEDSLVVMRIDGKLVTYINQIYLDSMMNFQSSTTIKFIDSILDASKETREGNKEKIKTLLYTYK